MNMRIKPTPVDFDTNAEFKLTKEQQRLVDEHMANRAALAEEIKKTKAKYKIELFFSHKRSQRGLNQVIMHFWQSGTMFHGGGDSKIYLCPGKRDLNNGCTAPIPVSSNTGGKCVCSKCGTIWESENTIGEIYFNVPMQTLAKALHHYYHVLDCDADVYLKYGYEDPRSILLAEQERNRGGELYAKMRKRRSMSIYPLANIIKDTSAGADLEKRFYAFLVA